MLKIHICYRRLCSWYRFREKIKIYIEGEITDIKYINEVIAKTEDKINRKITLLNEIDPFEPKLLIYESK